MSANKGLLVKDFDKALRQSGGLRTVAAKALGCTPSNVVQAVQRHPTLQKTIEEIREQTIDIAEAQLFRKIQEGNMTAIIFYLKCMAKYRGYNERLEVTGANGGPIATVNGHMAIPTTVEFVEQAIEQGTNGTPKELSD